jgi:hypothetical protein
MATGDSPGQWVDIPQYSPPVMASAGSSNTVSFEFPGGSMGMAALAIFAAGIIVGFLLCTFKPRSK